MPDRSVPPDDVIHLSAAALGRMSPLFVNLDHAGNILSTGPSLQRIARLQSAGGDSNDADLAGRNFFDVFTIRHPGGVNRLEDLHQRTGQRIHVHLRNAPDVGFRAVAMPTLTGGLLVKMAIGIDIPDAVRRLALSQADFAPTDLAVEMLFLVEANHAVAAELRRLNERLNDARVAAEQEAMTDTLTELANRRRFDLELKRLVSTCQSFGMMQIDLDHFKQVNDTHGHAAGDHVLQHVAQVLLGETRASDVVARVGGDEFLLLLPGLAKPDMLMAVAHRILAKLMRSIRYQTISCRVSASIGLTSTVLYQNHEIDAVRLLHDVDAATYASKHGGKSRATLHKVV